MSKMGLKRYRESVLMVGLVFLLILGTVNVCFAAAGQQQGQSSLPPENSTKIQVESGGEGLLQYKYEPGTPLTIMTQNTNIVMNSNTEVQLKYSKQSQIAVKYLGVDIDAQRPMTLEVGGDRKPNEVEGTPDSLGEYYHFESNETAQLTLRTFVDARDYSELLGRLISQEHLTWAYYNGEEWATVHSYYDEQGNLVAEGDCGQWTIREMRDGALPEIVPGVSLQQRSQVRALNYTDVEPMAFRYSLGEGEQTLFMFRNAEMVFGSTQPLRLCISVDNAVQSQSIGIQLQTSKTTTLNVSMTASPIGGSKEVKGIGVYMSIEHNATGTLKAQLAMPVDVDALKAKYGTTFDPNQLRWAWWNGESWVEVPSTMTNGVLTAETDHFSVWTILEAETTMNPVVTNEVAPAADYTGYYGFGALVLVAVGAIFFLKGRM